MKSQTKELLEQKSIPDGFIKVTEKPIQGLTSEQKVILNRKGNVFFNQGNIEDARRIYLTTGYSDGLIRVADIYATEKRTLEALKLYILAHNTSKAEPLFEKAAKTISDLLQDN